MILSDLTNPQLASMIRGYAIGRPDFAPLADEVANRLCEHSTRARTARASAHTVRTNDAETAPDAAKVRTEGGKGGGVLVPEMPLDSGKEPENKESNLNPYPIQARLRIDPISSSAHTVRTVVQQDSRGWTPGFAKFHATYPDGFKTNSSARYWVTNGLEEHAEKIIAAVEVWKLSERWRTGFVCSMAVFLSECLWEQSPPPPKTKATTEEKPEVPDTNQLLKDLEAEKARRKAAGIR